VDCDVRRGRYLDGLDLQRLLPSCRGAAQQWDAVITSPLPSMSSVLPRHGILQPPHEVHAASKALQVVRSVREQLLLEETIAALRRGGSVLIPADVAGWIPELLLLFEAAWSQDRQLATNYPVAWLSPLGDMVLDQIKTRLEYMSRETLTGFELRFGQNPFILKHVQIFQTLEELSASHPLTRPKVIMAATPHLGGGDAREVFMRLCAEPRSLLWLMGVPPIGTFARLLLDDFVLKHHTSRDYCVQQHVKQPLPEDQLRAYYEARIQELIDSGQRLPFQPADLLLAKLEDTMIPLPGDGHSVTPISGSAKSEEGTAKLDAKALTRLQLRDVSGTSTLWSPLGWPSSRTLAHSERRSEGDEYGHLLTTSELKAWRAQDQESSMYSMGGTAGLGELTVGEADGANAVKEEAAKVEDETPPSLLDGVTDWREALRIHFREPMRCEVRERLVQVACRIRFLPDSTLEPRDLYNLISMMAPKNVVLLPSADDLSATSMISKHLHCGKLVEGALAPETHTVNLDDPFLHLSLPGSKRKANFLPEIWTKVGFQKTVDSVRIARVRAAVRLPTEGSGARTLELGGCSVASDTSLEESNEKDRLPRQGALFVGLGPAPLSLSVLKEQLRAAEWTRDDVEVEFHAPGAHAAKPWSSRVLRVGGKATLGWRGNELQSDEAGAWETPPLKPHVATMRLEGLPSEEFFMARAALYRRCAPV